MAHLTRELLPVSEEGRPSCVYCSLPGEHLCFLTDKIMLFYMKGGGFYLTLFWGFVHVWNANICTFYMATFLLSREREDAVTDFCNIDCVLYCCDVCVVRHDDGLQKRPCWSSKHSAVTEQFDASHRYWCRIMKKSEWCFLHPTFPCEDVLLEV